MPFATRWIELEDIMLSEISQTHKDNNVCSHLYVESKRVNSIDMNLSKLRETVKDREAWQGAVHGVTKSWT